MLVIKDINEKKYAIYQIYTYFFWQPLVPTPNHWNVYDPKYLYEHVQENCLVSGQSTKAEKFKFKK